MAHFTRPQTTAAILSVCILAVGILTIVLAASADHSFWDNAGRGAACWPQYEVPYDSLSYIPLHLRKGPVHATIAAGAIAAACGLVHLVLVVKLLDGVRKNEEQASYEHRLQKWIKATAILGSCSAVLALVVFVYASAETYTSTHWHYEDDMSTFGHFSEESWLCQMQHQWKGEGYLWWARGCGEAQASRWLLVPLMGLAGALCWVQVKQVRSWNIGQTDIDSVELKAASTGS